MARKQKLISAAEFDAVTGWRRWLFWHRGELRKVKRALNKRWRREGRREARDRGQW